jgi:hypothetical protein
VLRKGRGETGFAARAGETMKRKEVKEEKLAIKKKKKKKERKASYLGFEKWGSLEDPLCLLPYPLEP